MIPFILLSACSEKEDGSITELSIYIEGEVVATEEASTVLIIMWHSGAQKLRRGQIMPGTERFIMTGNRCTVNTTI
jgi:hypothetical protein